MSAASSVTPVLMCGTGEYTTGWTPSGASKSDKTKGVVFLVCADLRRRGKVGDLSMVGVSGSKYPDIRKHLKKAISDDYNGLDVTFTGFPAEDKKDPEAYKEAIDVLPKGSAIIIFTPDPTHYPIALYALQKDMHVLITKPATQHLSHHQHLLEVARERQLVCWVEHHKRYDPAYADAKLRSTTTGDFAYWYSYMSQPKNQLETFSAWAGKDETDISGYLNSHHVDIHAWFVEGKFRPIRVTASAATGIATKEPYNCVPETEDTITLLVEWESLTEPGRLSTAVYTASWTAPMKTGVHSEQYFHYMASKGEIRANQARRGYSVAVDGQGVTDYNPFYMSYAPAPDGNFNGQNGYGYISIEKFIDAVNAVRSGKKKASDFEGKGYPTLEATISTTAILRAGRKSLNQGKSIGLTYIDGKYGFDESGTPLTTIAPRLKEQS